MLTPKVFETLQWSRNNAHCENWQRSYSLLHEHYISLKMAPVDHTTEVAHKVQLKSPSPDFEMATLEEEMPKQLEVEAPGAEGGEKKTLETEQSPTPESIPDPSIPAGEYYSNAAADYSDVPDLPTPDIPKQQRKHKRGGRKQRQNEQQSAQDFRDTQEPMDEENEEFERQEGRGPPTLPKLKHRPTNARRETGIKTFNLKRAESSGGRPFGISVENGDNDLEEVKKETKPKSKSKSKPPTKPKNKGKRKVKCEKCGRKSKKKEAEENWESEDSSDEESEEEEEGEKPKAQKPMSIRLDLNLELEIFLRAKIKGDVTITFL